MCDLLKLRCLQGLALFLYAFSLNFENLSLIGINFSLAKLAAIIYLVLLVISIPRFLKVTKKIAYFVWPVFFMILFFAIGGVAYIHESSLGLIELALLYNFIVFLLVICHAMQDPQVIERAMLGFAVGAVIVSVLLLSGVGEEISDNGRITFFGAGLNLLGLKLSTGFAILLSFFYRDNFRLGMFRYLLLVGAFILINAALMTGSRTSLLAVILIVVLMFLLQNERRMLDKLYAYMMFTAVISGILFMLAQSEHTINRLVLVFAEDEVVNNRGGRLGGRLEIWQNYIALVKEHWLFGLGRTGLEYHSIKAHGFYESPHNVLLEVFLYGGIFAVLLYSLFLFRVTLSAYKIYKMAQDNLPLLVMVPVMFSILANQALGIKYVWLMMAYVIVKYLLMYKRGVPYKL